MLKNTLKNCTDYFMCIRKDTVFSLYTPFGSAGCMSCIPVFPLLYGIGKTCQKPDVPCLDVQIVHYPIKRTPFIWAL